MFALGAIVSLCYIPGWTGAIIATQYAVLSAVLPFMLWRKGPVTFFHWLGIVLVVYAAISLAWNTDLYGGVYGLWLLCILALCFWFGSTLDQKSLQRIYAGLAIGGAVSSVVAIVQAFGYQLLPADAPTAGIYYNSVVQGGVLALLAVALMTERMYYYVLPLVPGIVLAHSRGAWLVLTIGLASLVIRRTWTLAIAVAVIVYAVAQGLSSDALRLKYWLIAWNELTLFGNGVGSFASQIYNDNGKVLYPEFVHNDALQLIYEYGLAAILPITIFVFALSRTQSRSWPVVMAFVTMGMFFFPLWSPITAFIGLLAVGRVVRVWHLDGRDRYNFRFTLDAWERAVSGRTVSMVGTNKGSC